MCPIVMAPSVWLPSILTAPCLLTSSPDPSLDPFLILAPLSPMSIAALIALGALTSLAALDAFAALAALAALTALAAPTAGVFGPQ